MSATVNCLECSGVIRVDVPADPSVGLSADVEYYCSINEKMEVGNQFPAERCPKMQISKYLVCPECLYDNGNVVNLWSNIADDTPVDLICPECGQEWTSLTDYARDCAGAAQDAQDDCRYAESRLNDAMDIVRHRSGVREPMSPQGMKHGQCAHFEALPTYGGAVGECRELVRWLRSIGIGVSSVTVPWNGECAGCPVAKTVTSRDDKAAA